MEQQVAIQIKNQNLAAAVIDQVNNYATVPAAGAFKIAGRIIGRQVFRNWRRKIIGPDRAAFAAMPDGRYLFDKIAFTVKKKDGRSVEFDQ